MTQPDALKKSLIRSTSFKINNMTYDKLKIQINSSRAKLYVLNRIMLVKFLKYFTK
jgi:hypothetical protein